jgi:hypothetical protein
MIRRRSTVLALVGLLTAVGAVVVAPGGQAGAAATATTITVVRDQRRPDGTVVRSQMQVPATVRNLVRRSAKPTGPNGPAPAKLSPRLAAAVNDPTAPATERVIITFKEDRRIPRFPELDSRLGRAAVANVRAQAHSDALMAGIAGQRQAGYQALSADLARLGVQTLETFWLIKGMVVVAPRAALPMLARRADVAYVEPAEGGMKPPDADPNNDEEDARALLGTDPHYFSSGLSFVGVLDTGVRRTHVLLRDNFAGFAEDMVNPTNPNPDDCFVHGTSTASVIAGGDALGPTFRGMTRNIVDSFKVYRSDACGLLVPEAAVRGFQRAVQVGDRVIVAELGTIENEFSALSAAADAAYDAGAVVVAADGNTGPNPGSVVAPAVAQKVLGIGAVDLQTHVTPDFQGVGPTADGRVKPDVQAPTNVETGSSQSDTATQVYGGTSAATAHAGGMAGVVRNLVRAPDRSVDPGAVYAYMLAMGVSNVSASDRQGAGLMVLGPNWSWVVAHPTISNLQQLDLPLGVGPNQSVRLAIWWPELPATHNDIDVSLIGPDGHTVFGESLSVKNVFERVITSSLPEGVYTVEIHGYNVPSGTQDVHMVAITTP